MQRTNPNILHPLTSAWLLNPDRTRTLVKIDTRVGGVYRVELPGGDTKLVNRHQLVRYIKR